MNFLKSIAKLYYDNIGADNRGDITLADILFVFPNRRAGLFFKREYCATATHSTFAPETIDINRFTAQLSSLSMANDVELLLHLYNSYTAVIQAKKEGGEMVDVMSFDEFIPLGSMMLTDFDEVDKYLVDASMLFTNTDNLKSLTIEPNFFTENQLNAIGSFWSNALKSDDDGALSFQEHFVSIWSLLAGIYQHFRAQLAELGIAYQGMIYRDVVENILPHTAQAGPYKRIVFIGFNILTASERAIMVHFQKHKMADFYFDYPGQYGRGSVLSKTVGAMYDTNLKEFKSLYHYAQPSACQCAGIHIYSTPSVTEEVATAATIINRSDTRTDAGSGSAKSLSETTLLVLADESLLTPMIKHLPRVVEKVNITMGFPLSKTTVATLIDNIVMLQSNLTSRADGTVAFYHRWLIAVLSHPYIQMHYGSIPHSLVDHLTANNYIRIDVGTLHGIIDSIILKSNDSPSDAVRGEALKKILSIHTAVDETLKYLSTVLGEIILCLSDDLDRGARHLDAELEMAFVVQYRAYVLQLSAFLSSTGTSLNVSTLYQLISRLTGSLKVPFVGEPLDGFQIMGTLESRLLDFDNIIILGFNDKNIPGTHNTKSLLPYTLRRAYGLPTHEMTDAIAAYNFYRTLYHARTMHLIYNNRQRSSSNDVSRYYYQLRYLMPRVVDGISVTEHNIESHIPRIVSHSDVVSITKDAIVMDRLNQYRSPNGRTISASALKNYIACPLKFYFAAVAHVYEANEIDEVGQSSLLGTIYHKAMELYYRRRTKPSALTGSECEKLVEEAFSAVRDDERENKRGLELAGFNLLICRIVQQFVLTTVSFDCRRTPFKLLSTEEDINVFVEGVNYKAIVDRTDMTLDSRRINIIDYKTTRTDSTKDPSFSLTKMFCGDDHAHHEVFQTLLYCYIYLASHNECPPVSVRPNIYNIYSLNRNKRVTHDAFERQVITVKVPTAMLTQPLSSLTDADILSPKVPTTPIVVSSYADIKPYFEYMLHRLISEIFDPGIPFAQRKTTNSCRYCPYRYLCGEKKN